MKIFILVSCLSLLPALAMAIETPDYKVLSKDKKFEVRDYPALTVARTAMGDGDFMRLFRFISGENEAKQKIAMTAPVLMQEQGDQAGMSFVVPREVAAREVPQPGDKAVTLATVPPARYAVYVFSGGRNQANESKALEALRVWVATKGLEVTGEPVFGYYDPPWIPGFWRRNEVMLRVVGSQP